MSELFRTEALAAESDQRFGEIVVQRSLSSWAMTCGALIILIMLVLFVTSFSYTRRITATGIVSTSAGVIRIRSSSSGILGEPRVKEGQVVKRGDALFIIEDNRSLDRALLESKGSRPAHAARYGYRVTDAVSGSYDSRLEMIRAEREQRRRAVHQEIDSVNRQVSQLGEELEAARTEEELSKKRTELAETRLTQLANLAAQDFMSRSALDDKTDGLTALKLAQATASRTATSLRRSMMSLQATREQLEHRLALEMADLDQREAQLIQERTEFQARSDNLVVAPVDGIVTGVLAEQGAYVNGQILATIVPDKQELRVYLYVPSRSVGFIRAGQNVMLRFQAFPYQKFGQYGGSVTEVSRAQIAQDQLPDVVPQDTREGVYRITVELKKKYVLAYGHHEPIMPGMVVEADVLQETRSVLEWIFEPLIGVKEKQSIRSE